MLTVEPGKTITGSNQIVVVVCVAWLGTARLNRAMRVRRAVACPAGQHLHARAIFNLLPLPNNSVPLSCSSV